MTPNLALTLLAASQAQKHVTINEALTRIDAAAQTAVLTRTLTAPPTTPADGDRYLIDGPATGDWQGHEDQIAAWDAPAQGWLFLTPHPGWRVWIIDEDTLLARTAASTWQPVGGGGQLNPVAGDLLGVNTSADAANRLAVASPGVLLTHEGAGIRTKLNKAAASDTASLLLQTNYSTRTEFGLVGDDDTVLKTSPDGSAFTEAMRIPAATARPGFPQGITLAGATPLTRYEEGDFTLTLGPGATSGQWDAATGLAVESARYTRIGNLVHLRAAFRFTGLPDAPITAATSRSLDMAPFTPTDAAPTDSFDHAGMATIVGPLSNGGSAFAFAYLNKIGRLFLSLAPPAINPPETSALILLNLTYEAD